MKKLKPILLTALMAGPIGVPAKASVTVTVSTSAPASLEQKFIADTTRQYVSTMAPTPYFVGSYSIKLFSVNPLYTLPPPPVVSSTVVTLDTLISEMIDKSTWTYIYGYASGMDYQRHIDMGRISDYMTHCATNTYFNVASSSSWDQGACTTSLAAVLQDIYNLKFSSPTVIPPVAVQ